MRRGIVLNISEIDCPEVFGMAAELGLDPDAVLGKLVRVAAYFAIHSDDMCVRSFDPFAIELTVDRLVGCPGFFDAMQSAFMMAVDEGGHKAQMEWAGIADDGEVEL